MVSIAGIAGYRKPTIRAFSYPLAADAIVVLHSDGVSGRWTRRTSAVYWAGRRR